MTLGYVEFKARFGKVAIDTVTPEQRYLALRQAILPKIQAGMKRGDQASLDAWAALKLRVGKQDWSGAADVLEEARAIPLDNKRAAKVRQELADACAPALKNGRLPEALKGAHAAVEAAVVEDRYADAEEQLIDLKVLVADHLQRCVDYTDKLVEVDKLKVLVAARAKAKAFTTDESKQANIAFGQHTTALMIAGNSQDFALASTLFVKLQQTAQTLLANPVDDSPQKLYEARYAASKPELEAWEQLALEKSPLFALHQAAVDELVASLVAARTAFDEAKYGAALQALDEAVAAVPALKTSLQQHNAQLATSLPFSNDVKKAIDANKLPANLPGNLNAQDLKKQYVARSIAMNGGDWAKAIRCFAGYEAGFRALWQCMEAEPKPVGGPPVSPKAVEYQQLIAGKNRAAITAALLQPDADLAGFRAQPGGTKLLDDLVTSIGAKADTPEKREFVKAAMMARFGLKEVTGGEDGKGLSTKALPRMYKLLALLPPEHTTDNELLQSIERQKGHDTSTHNAGAKKVVLKAGKAGKEGGNFDDTTLHEVGHAVDAKFNFMGSNGKARQFGGWQDETFDSVLKVAGEQLGFHRHFAAKGVDRALLENYLKLALGGSNPATLQGQFKVAKDPTAQPSELLKHPAIVHAVAGQKATKDDDDLKRDLCKAASKLVKDKEPMKSLVLSLVETVSYGKKADEAIGAALASLKVTGNPPSDALWQEMAVHPAIDFASNVRMKAGSSGLWDQGDSGAQRCAVNGRVYQEAYSNTWCSYLLGARASKVCNYQFRHRMEWFAECYSRYFLNTLGSTHPLSAWLSQQKAAAKPG